MFRCLRKSELRLLEMKVMQIQTCLQNQHAGLQDSLSRRTLEEQRSSYLLQEVRWASLGRCQILLTEDLLPARSRFYSSNFRGLWWCSGEAWRILSVLKSDFRSGWTIYEVRTLRGPWYWGGCSSDIAEWQLEEGLSLYCNSLSVGMYKTTAWFVYNFNTV